MERVEHRLIIFVKTPIPGRVKTRLISAIGEEAASALYEKMALHCITEGVEADIGPVDLWCTPSSNHPFFIKCAQRFRVNLHHQIEGDLGQRMAHAFSKTLKVASYALLMGSDCPSLTRSDIRAAKATLEKQNDAVIIPAEDGGYVLLGLRRNTPELFSGISWGTGAVLEETRQRLGRLGWNWHELPEKWDVDRPEDVGRLKRDGLGIKFLTMGGGKRGSE